MSVLPIQDRVAYLPPIPPAWANRAMDAERDYYTAVRHAVSNHPRSLQKAIGPSEIGDPCARKLLYKLAGTPERDLGPNWKATVGTGGHLWQEDAFDLANQTFALSAGTPGVERWLIEETVTVGTDANGTPITGHCDLFDRATGTVIDHKFVGRFKLKDYKANGPSAVYRAQAHLYGQGWVNAGMQVNQVAISFLPRDGELADAYWWSEPFQPDIASAALQRLQGLQLTLQAVGDQAFGLAPTADSYCRGCAFLRFAPTPDLALGCPGHPGAIPATQPPLTFTK